MFRHKIVIPGKPIAKKTHRDGATIKVYHEKLGKYGYRRLKYNPLAKEVEEVKKIIKSQFPHRLLNEPLIVEYLFEFQIAKSWRLKQKQEALEGIFQHWQKPDVTNLVKFYEDCMIGTVYEDDCIICCSPPIKRWAQEASTTIWIRQFTQEELLKRIKELIYD